MKVLEFEAKALLAKEGLAVPQGELVTRSEDAAVVAERIGGPVVVKVQIPSGGRMKAGGILFAGTPEATEMATNKLLGQVLFGHPVQSVLIEKQLEVAAEIFAGVTYDSQTRQATVLASRAGGIEVERDSQVVRRPISILGIVPDYLGLEVAAELGLGNRDTVRLAKIINQLITCFIRWDCLLLETNPLILDKDGHWWLADVHLELDDDATYRQQSLLDQLPASGREMNRRSDFERKAAEIDSADHRGVAGRLVPFDGDLGLLIGGGGASLTIMDAVLKAGLKPANYCEIGGNPSVWKTKELTKLILQQEGVERLAVIMNVVSNTRVDLVARGVIKGILELGREPREAIAAFRIPGSWEEEGEAILNHYGVPFYGRESSIDQVVETLSWPS